MIEFFLEPYGEISRLPYFAGTTAVTVACTVLGVGLGWLAQGTFNSVMIWPALIAALIIVLGSWWSVMMMVVKRGNELGLAWWASVVLIHLPFGNLFFYLYLLFVPKNT